MTTEAENAAGENGLLTCPVCGSAKLKADASAALSAAAYPVAVPGSPMPSIEPCEAGSVVTFETGKAYSVEKPEYFDAPRPAFSPERPFLALTVIAEPPLFYTPPASPVSGEGWQTIESAPKDSRDVLLTSPLWNGDVMIGSWSFGEWRERPDPNADTLHPTLWMPVPASASTVADREAAIRANALSASKEQQS